VSITTSYLDTVTAGIERIQTTQADAIRAAGQACAKSIAGDGLAFTFGTGHGSFAALECFPRTGTPVGFRPIVENALSNFHHVLGDQGSYQYRFLHTLEGYGHAIMRAHRFVAGDTMVLFSHSGINAVILDMALESQARGMTVVGITSVPHSSAVPARHSSGKRLFEVADVVIDTGVPLQDASVPVEGYPFPVGPTSTVFATAVAHAMVGEAVQELVRLGRDPHVMVNPNTAKEHQVVAHRQNDENYEQLWQLLRSR
jgi:uncharacterized phosphosugar-binding protein